MSDVILTRFGYTPHGTFGTVKYKDFFAYTVERPWVDNAAMVSSIPEGDYVLQWYNSPKFGRTLAVVGGTVSLFPSNHHKRSAILFHTANIMDDLLGCIGLGSALGFVANKWAVVQSKVTVNQFLDTLRARDNIPMTINFINGGK